MKTKFYAFILIPTVTTLAACQADEAVSGYSGPDTTWSLQQIDGDAFDADATLTFPEAGKIAGKAPCNSYFGEMKAPYPKFDPSMIASTKMACPELAAEDRFFTALGAMTKTEISGDTLVLSDGADRKMRFKAQ